MITQFMLTKNDVTIPNAFDVYAEVAAAFTPEELEYVGFKNVGHPLEVLRRLGEIIVADGRKLVIEIVGASAETEREAATLAVDLGADILIGGTHSSDVLEVIAGTGIGYYPTVGDLSQEPGRIYGTIDDIVAETTASISQPGVNGIMLLGYRYVGDISALLTAISEVPDIKVVNAGSVDSAARIRELADQGYWAFTIGSAVLDFALPAESNLEAQLRWVLETAK